MNRSEEDGPTARLLSFELCSSTKSLSKSGDEARPKAPESESSLGILPTHERFLLQFGNVTQYPGIDVRSGSAPE